MGKPDGLDQFFTQLGAPPTAPSPTLEPVEAAPAGGEEIVAGLRKRAKNLLAKAHRVEEEQSAVEKAACLARVQGLIEQLSPLFHTEKWVPVTALKAAKGRLPEGFDEHLFVKQIERRGELRDLNKMEFQGEECVVLDQNDWPRFQRAYSTTESAAVTALPAPAAEQLHSLMTAWDEFRSKHEGSLKDLPDRVGNEFIRHLLGSRVDSDFGTPNSRASFELEEGEKVLAYNPGSGALSDRASKDKIPTLRRDVDLTVLTGAVLRKFW